MTPSSGSTPEGQGQCAACPVFTGECPECGTFWWTRNGKRYGMRPVTARDAQAIRQLQQRNNTAGIVYLRELPNVVMP